MRREPVDIIADALHRAACLEPAICQAEPSPQQQATAQTVLAALRREGYVVDGDAETVELLGSIWLYVRWRYVTKQLTTAQKEMWADIVDEWSRRINAAGERGPVADRWWKK